MAQEFRVKTVVKSEEWTGNDSTPMRTQELLLEGVPKVVKAYSQARYEAIVEGATIFGDVEGEKFRFKSRTGGGSPTTSSTTTTNGASGGGQPDQAYWEAKDRRIQRQHAQEMALRMYELARTEGIMQAAANPSELLKRVTELADRLDADVNAVGSGQRTLPTSPDESIPF